MRATDLQEVIVICFRARARPPLLGALDVRRNEVPLSLYAAASIGGLAAPNLYLIDRHSAERSGFCRKYTREPDCSKSSKAHDAIGMLNSTLSRVHDVRVTFAA